MARRVAVVLHPLRRAITDIDGDGLNDASEAQLAGLGFNWQVSQPALVAGLPGLLNPAGFYDIAQMQALSFGSPLIQKDAATGKFKLIVVEFEFPATGNAAFFRFVTRDPQPLALSSAVADFQQTAPYVVASSLLPDVEGWGGVRKHPDDSPGIL